MARTTFQGPVRSLGGIYQQGPAAVVEITTSTTLSPEAHGGRIISVGGSLAAALTLTLPAIKFQLILLHLAPAKTQAQLTTKALFTQSGFLLPSLQAL